MPLWMCPDEVLTSVMRTHQKYFALNDPATGKAWHHILLPLPILKLRIMALKLLQAMNACCGRGFLMVGSSGTKTAKISLEARLPELAKIVFHARLGTVADKTARLENLVADLSPVLGAHDDAAHMAARLCKADLVSGMVYEFPELQGIMGGYYAENDGLGTQVGQAIRAHYAPRLARQMPSRRQRKAVRLHLPIKSIPLAGFWMID